MFSVYFTLEEISNFGYDIGNIEYVEDVGYWNANIFARKHDIDLEDVYCFRLSEGKWIICHKLNPKQGYISRPILNF
jgi:hypothetical protein